MHTGACNLTKLGQSIRQLSIYRKFLYKYFTEAKATSLLSLLFNMSSIEDGIYQGLFEKRCLPPSAKRI